MKAWRNQGGRLVEITIDIDLEGNPILPPDTTTDAKPEPLEGHYVTVVGREWVQIPVPVYVETFEQKKSKKLETAGRYKAWLLDQPVEINGLKFDADEQARDRLIQALVISNETGVVPQAWYTYDNQAHPLADLDALKAIVNAVHSAFSARFFEANTIRDSINLAENEEALNEIVIPEFGGFGVF